MSYKRAFLPTRFHSGSKLDSDLASMGISVSSPGPSVDANIENTLVAAVMEELVNGGTRTLSLVTNWLEVHSARVNVDRLYRILDALDKKYLNVKIYFSALGGWLSSDRRFEKIASLYQGNRVNYLSLLKSKSLDFTSSLLKKNGEDARFENTSIIVPNGVIRRRLKDVSMANDIVKFHMPFRYRVMMGPSYRADMWAVLRRNPTHSAYKVASLAYGSYESARQVKKDYLVVKRDYSKRDLAV